MNAATKVQIVTLGHELVFRDLLNEGNTYVFPCDSTGHVDMDVLSESARNNYFYARVVAGNSISVPIVRSQAMWCLS